MTITELMDRFYRKDFSFLEATGLLGEPGEETSNQIAIRPAPRSNLELAALEKFERSGKPDFLAGIHLRFKVPEKVDFAALAQRFGPEQELPRLKPWEKFSYTFPVRGVNYSGYILLTTPDTIGKVRSVNRLILRRGPEENPLLDTEPPASSFDTAKIPGGAAEVHRRAAEKRKGKT